MIVFDQYINSVIVYHRFTPSEISFFCEVSPSMVMMSFVKGSVDTTWPILSADTTD